MHTPLSFDYSKQKRYLKSKRVLVTSCSEWLIYQQRNTMQRPATRLTGCWEG